MIFSLKLKIKCISQANYINKNCLRQLLQAKHINICHFAQDAHLKHKIHYVNQKSKYKQLTNKAKTLNNNFNYVSYTQICVGFRCYIS